MEKLGKFMLYDDTMSNPSGYACATCHAPSTGLSTGLSSIVNFRGGPQPGVVPGRFGPRKPMSYGYAAFSPEGPYFDTQNAVWIGGNFWDLRATGYKLQNADADQAQHPVLDTQEHGFPDAACIVFRLSQSRYTRLFKQIWGDQPFDIDWPRDTEEICSLYPVARRSQKLPP